MTRLNRLLPPFISPLLLSAAAVTFTGCVHSITMSDSLPVKEAAALITPEPNAPADNPTLSAEEIGKRFLKLIEVLESREDLSLERVQSVLGVPLKRFDGTPHYLFGYSQPLADCWYFSVDYISGSPSLLRGVSLEFGKPGKRFPEFPADVCTLDFDHYHNALEAMGFLAEPHYGEIGELRSWRYTKFKKSDGTVDMTISIIPQNVVAGKPGRVCVKSISTLNGR